VVKGGKNPGGSLTVLDNGKSISEKGIKRTPDAEAMVVPGANGKGISEKGMKYKAVEGDVIHPAGKSTSVVYSDDFKVVDAALLKYLGVKELIIEKGEYPFNYSNNPNGQVTLMLKGVIHRDLAARNRVFNGYDPDTQTTITYTIEPIYNKGVADKIMVTYKGHSEKGIK
jgi:hypothetical protein